MLACLNLLYAFTYFCVDCIYIYLFQSAWTQLREQSGGINNQSSKSVAIVTSTWAEKCLECGAFLPPDSQDLDSSHLKSLKQPSHLEAEATETQTQ